MHADHPLPAPSPASGTPVGTPLLRSDPSAVPQVGEGDVRTAIALPTENPDEPI